MALHVCLAEENPAVPNPVHEVVGPAVLVHLVWQFLEEVKENPEPCPLIRVAAVCLLEAAVAVVPVLVPLLLLLKAVQEGADQVVPALLLWCLEEVKENQEPCPLIQQVAEEQ